MYVNAVTKSSTGYVSGNRQIVTVKVITDTSFSRGRRDVWVSGTVVSLLDLGSRRMFFLHHSAVIIKSG